MFEIKETDKEAEVIKTSNEAVAANPAKTGGTTIAAAQKWVAPPRIKNLKSKKNRAV